jgi:hypothetical protein
MGFNVPLIQRRNFLIGLGSLLAAPAIVRVQSIMPVKVVKQFTLDDYAELILKPMVNRLQDSMANDIFNHQCDTFGYYLLHDDEIKIRKVTITEIYNVPLENKA